MYPNLYSSPAIQVPGQRLLLTPHCVAIGYTSAEHVYFRGTLSFQAMFLTSQVLSSVVNVHSAKILKLINTVCVYGITIQGTHKISFSLINQPLFLYRLSSNYLWLTNMAINLPKVH